MSESEYAMRRVEGWKASSVDDTWVATLECGHTSEFTRCQIHQSAQNPLLAAELLCPTCAEEGKA